MLKIADKNRNDEQPPTTTLLTNHSLEAEILGVPLSDVAYATGDPKKALMCILELPRDSFTLDDHKSVYDGYVSLVAKGLSPTQEHMQLALTETGKWQPDESKGGGIGNGFIFSLIEKGGVITELPLLCKELRDNHWKRQCISASFALHATASSNNGPWEDVMEKFAETSETFSKRPNIKAKPTDITSLITKDLEILEQQARGVFEDSLIKTGFQSIDNSTGGFGPGSLVVLAARPGMGKTSMALDLALKIVQEQIPTVVFTFEMTSQEIIRRIMSKLTKINVLKLKRGDLEDWQIDQYKKAAVELNQYPLDICDVNLVPEQIDFHIQALNRKLNPGQIRLVIVDHLHIMGQGDKSRYDRRDLKLATYSGQLKEIAKRHECCVVLLSQLNRMLEHRPLDERLPRSSDLRDSGAIEQDADVILGIHLPMQDDQKADKHLAKIRIMKNRSGPTGILDLKWTGEVASFSNPDNYSDVPF